MRELRGVNAVEQDVDRCEARSAEHNGSTIMKKRTRLVLVVRHGRKRNEIITDLPSRRDVLRG